MIKYFTLLLLLIFSYSAKGQVSYCSVFGSYEETPMSEVITGIEKWCKVSIKQDAVNLNGLTVTQEVEGVPIKMLLNILFKDIDIGYEILDDATIVLKQKSALNKYVRISNSFKNTELGKILDIWSFNHKLKIDYKSADLKNIKVTGTLKDESLTSAFTKILANTDLQFETTGPKNIRIYKSDIETKNIAVYESISTNLTMSGIIKDAETGESLPFANVMVTGTSIGASTNVDGIFTIFNVPCDTAQLEYSYLGYRPSTFRLNPSIDIENLELELFSGGFELDEITINAVKADQMLNASSGISKLSLTPEIASILPNYGEKDIFRSLQLLPGISGTNESSSGLFVRGGTPDQNLILFDGFTVYHVDHLFGFFSAFNSNAIKDVQLHKGGYEAKYGGRLSSVVDMTGKDGNTEQFNMGFGASLLAMNGFVEAPFADGKGSFILTGRRSFQSDFYSNLFDSFTDIGQAPDGGNLQPGRFGQTQVQPNSYFYDLNAKLTYRLGQKDKISMSLYNGEDDLDNSRVTDSESLGGFGRFPGGGGGNANFSFVNDNIDVSNWGNIGGSVKWSRQWSDKFYSNATASYSNYFSVRDRTNQTNVTQTDTSFVRSTGSYENNDLRDLSFKLDNEYLISQNNKLDFGFNITQNAITYDYTQNDTISLISRDDNAVTAAFYVQDRLTFNDKLILQAGVRANYYSPTSNLYIEPRVSATYLVNDKFKLKGAFGLYNQFATRVVREDIQQGSRDFWILADDEIIPTSSSTHYIFGGAYETKGFLFDIEAFFKDYKGLSEYTNRLSVSGRGPSASLSIDEQFFSGTGTSKGIEFLVQKKFGDFTGWLGYTLSEVKYDFEDFSDEPFYANQDQRHEFKAVAAYKLGKFDFSTTFVYGTGRPYTAPVGYYELELLDGSEEAYFQISDKNALRYPTFHRWDASVNYNFNIGTSKAKVGLSVFNIYNRTNTWYKEYEVIEGELLESDISLLGRTPSIFFNWSLN